MHESQLKNLSGAPQGVDNKRLLESLKDNICQALERVAIRQMA